MADSVLLGPDSLGEPARLHQQLDDLEKKIATEDDAVKELVTAQAEKITALETSFGELQTAFEAVKGPDVVYVDLGTPGTNTLVEHNLGILRPDWWLYCANVIVGSAGTPTFIPIDENSGRLQFPSTGPGTSIIMKFKKSNTET